MQGTCLDEREVGDQGAHLRQVLDAADEVAVVGIVLVHHRRAVGLRMPDQHVHLVALERRLARLGAQGNAEERRRLALLGLAEELRVVEHVLLGARKVLADLRQVLVLLLQVADQAVHRGMRDLAVEVAELVLRLAPPLRHVLDDGFQLLLQPGDRRLEALALGLGQGAEAVRLHHRVLFQRREGEARRRAHQGDALRARLVADRRDGVLLALVELGLDLLAAGAVLVGLEGGRDAGLQVLDELAHVLPELRRAAGGELQPRGLVRRVEVEHVAPVRRHRLACGALGEQLPHDRVPPVPLGSHGVEVEPLGADADAEADRLHRPRLREHPFRVLQVVGGGEARRGQVAAAAQLLGGEPARDGKLGRGHRRRL